MHTADQKMLRRFSGEEKSLGKIAHPLLPNRECAPDAVPLKKPSRICLRGDISEESLSHSRKRESLKKKAQRQGASCRRAEVHMPCLSSLRCPRGLSTERGCRALAGSGLRQSARRLELSGSLLRRPKRRCRCAAAGDANRNGSLRT